jgi:hypothetical protein
MRIEPIGFQSRSSVTPAKAGAHAARATETAAHAANEAWVPAFAGTTKPVFHSRIPEQPGFGH